MAAITPEALEVLRGVLAQRCGHAVELAVPNLAGGQAARGDATRNQAYRAAQADPLVRELQRRFDADIIAREPSPRARFLADFGTADDDAGAS